MDAEDKEVNILLVDWTDLSYAGRLVFWETFEVRIEYLFVSFSIES